MLFHSQTIKNIFPSRFALIEDVLYRGPIIFFGHFSIRISEYHRVAKFLQ